MVYRKAWVTIKNVILVLIGSRYEKIKKTTGAKPTIWQTKGSLSELWKRSHRTQQMHT